MSTVKIMGISFLPLIEIPGPSEKTIGDEEPYLVVSGAG